MRRVIQRKVVTTKIVSVTLTWVDDDDERESPASDSAVGLPAKSQSSDPQTPIENASQDSTKPEGAVPPAVFEDSPLQGEDSTT